MIDYVVGFIFSPGFEDVLLVQKKRPEWQRGILNGCGGKVEGRESHLQAMARECEEETGLLTKRHDWTRAAIMTGPTWRVAVLFLATADIVKARTMTDEPVCIYRTRDVQNVTTVPHLQWLIPLCTHFGSAVHGTAIVRPVLVFEELTK